MEGGGAYWRFYGQYRTTLYTKQNKPTPLNYLPGMRKINLSGGEPFIHKKGNYVGELVSFCKKNLNVESVTIVSNGSLITEQWFKTYGGLVNM